VSMGAYAARLLLDALARGERCVELRVLPLPERGVVARGVLPGVEEDGSRVCVVSPLELALYALRMGAAEKAVVRALDWRMFEEYAARVLGEAGFQVWRDIRLHGAGGFQVDVLGLDGYGHGLVLECKHWSPRNSAPSRLREAAARHLERTRRLALHWRRLGLPGRGYRLVPALLVLRETGVPRLVHGVPVVPVSRLRGLIEEFDYLLEDPAVAKLQSGAR